MEIYAGADYKGKNWLVGAGIELLSIKPRTESKVETPESTPEKKHYNTYKVNERITTLSYEAHLKYSNANWLFTLSGPTDKYCDCQMAAPVN